MADFQVGDMVRGLSDDNLTSANTQMARGLVTYADEVLTAIRILEHSDKSCISTTAIIFGASTEDFEVIEHAEEKDK